MSRVILLLQRIVLVVTRVLALPRRYVVLVYRSGLLAAALKECVREYPPQRSTQPVSASPATFRAPSA